MNRIDFLKYNQFPLSTETFNALQDMVFLVARLASLGGNSYILSGCDKVGNTISPGYLVINGEILPFEGGTISSHVTIIEEKSGVNVYGDNYQDIYVTRKAVFGSGSPSYPWLSFKPLKNIVSLTNDLKNLSEAFNEHVFEHTVSWANVINKPTAFQPISHSHPWNDISNKPSTYPPSTHGHPGMGVFLGHFDYHGTTVTKIYGTIDVSVARIETGKYKLFHNIGHKNYIVLGVGHDEGSKAISLRSNIVVETNDCIVGVSDDASLNDASIRFCIISFNN